MNTTTSPIHRFVTSFSLATVAVAALTSASANAAEDDEFIEEATLEDLEEAGYLIEGTDDVKSELINFQHMIDHRADAILDLAAAAFGKEAVELAAIGDLLGITDSLHLVNTMPDATGQPGTPSIIIDLDDLTSGPDLGGLSAKLPSAESLAKDGWERISVNDDGSETWTKHSENEDGSGSGTVIRVSPSGEIVESRTWDLQADGRGTETVSEVQEDGSTITVYREVDGDKVVSEVTEYQGPGVDEPPPPPDDSDVAELPPADGDGEVYCPLYLPACRAAAEEAEKDGKDPYRLISGFVFVNPGPDGAVEPPKVVPLIVDPAPFAVNPDPYNMSGEYANPPTAFRIDLPVAVLPPKPNS